MLQSRSVEGLNGISGKENNSFERSVMGEKTDSTKSFSIENRSWRGNPGLEWRATYGLSSGNRSWRANTRRGYKKRREKEQRLV
jgi:hypothetical protein